VQNPHDSVALQRAVNTPPRGIGKTTLETLERMALETGVSTWEAIGAAIRNRLVPARAARRWRGFGRLIRDARALMQMDGTDFAGKLEADLAGLGFGPAEARRGGGFEFGDGFWRLGRTSALILGVGGCGRGDGF
jgi:hypothetical protein